MTPNESPAALLPARWYVVSNFGGATLCVDEADARKVASECDIAWPNHAPHIAVQLVPAASESRGCLCQGCGVRYIGDLMVSDDVWERIKPEGSAIGGGLLCASCIVSRAVEVGLWTAAYATDSESRGSVPDGVTHNERVMCEAIVRHQFQDAHRDGRLTIDVETLLHEYNEHKVAAPTPPAVASGEPTAEQWFKAIAEVHGRTNLVLCPADGVAHVIEQRARELARSAAAKGEG